MLEETCSIVDATRWMVGVDGDTELRFAVEALFKRVDGVDLVA